jgi:predicted nucleic acid-binding protein
MPLFVDTSAIVALLFAEEGAPMVRTALKGASALLASPLLEAELMATLVREDVPAAGAARLLGTLRWVMPDRPLTEEIGRVLAVGHLRGADTWHLATALYLSPRTEDLAFLTLDTAQRERAAALGFRAPGRSIR